MNQCRILTFCPEALAIGTEGETTYNTWMLSKNLRYKIFIIKCKDFAFRSLRNSPPPV